MRSIAIASVFMATAPVFAICMLPDADGEVVAVFSEAQQFDSYVERSRDIGLKVVATNPQQRHITVQDQDGHAATALYAMGARLVIDADLLTACQARPGNTI
ncbi:hypothetical protein [Ponticaulis profundi]|uniref:Uncharacterized protein n=1 Tax=Ponticaulis profundi TaxID=2665222 RepID=A0ABW1SAU8_9PROT